MANHAKQIPPAQTQAPLTPEPPRIEWGQIQRVGNRYHLVTMITQGGKVLAQNVGEGHEWRPVVEAEFQRWAVDNVLDRNEAA